MPRVHRLSLALLAVVGCKRGFEAPATHEEAATPLPPASIVLAGDPLRDPRELKLRHLRQLTYGGQARWPRFSPDGKRLAFLSRPVSADGGVPAQTLAKLVDLTSFETKALTPAPAGEDWIALDFRSDGTLCGAAVAQSCHPSLGWAADPVVPAACYPPHVLPLGPGNCAPPFHNAHVEAAPYLCSGGKAATLACLVAATPSSSAVWLQAPAAPAGRSLSEGPGLDFHPTFSSNGLFLAFATTRGQPEATAEEAVNSQIEAVSLGDPALRLHPLGPSGHSNVDPAVFPDGRVCFASNADDAAGKDYDLFVATLDGASLLRVTFAAGADVDPTVSPNGQKIAFASERNASGPGEIDLFLADYVDGPQPTSADEKLEPH